MLLLAIASRFYKDMRILHIQLRLALAVKYWQVLVGLLTKM